MLGRCDTAQQYYRATARISKAGSELNLLARTSLLFLELATNGTNAVSRNARHETRLELDATEAAHFTIAGQMIDAITTNSIQKSKSVFLPIALCMR